MFNPEYMPRHYAGKFAESEEEAHRWLEDKANNRRPPELLPRDVVSRAIYREVLAGRGSEHGGAYLDVTHRGADYIKRKLPSMYEQFHALGDIDITRQPMEVYPTIHYTMGGVRVEPETGASTVPGLFAAGETAAGVHGANRLGGNSLTDILVFGKRAGDGAVAYAAGVEHGALSREEIAEEQSVLLAPLSGGEGENPYELSRELQEAMQAGAMIARDEPGLTACLEKVRELKERATSVRVPGDRRYNPGWHTARDIRFSLDLSEAIVLSALERRESRGAQWRLDYPEKSEELGRVNFVVRCENGRAMLTSRPVPEPSPELAAVLEEAS